MVKLLHKVNKNTMITALVEDGMLEEHIWLPVALYGEMMWNCERNTEDLLTQVALRPDVEC